MLVLDNRVVCKVKQIHFLSLFPVDRQCSPGSGKTEHDAMSNSCVLPQQKAFKIFGGQKFCFFFFSSCDSW